MEFTEHKGENLINIDNYENEKIIINEQAHDGVLALYGEQLEQASIHSFSQLNEEFFQETFNSEVLPEIILIGTGLTQQFLHPRITAFLSQKGIGVEVMATAPACRTFNILQSENRKVWALLFTQ